MLGRCHFFMSLGKTVNFSLLCASEGTLSRWSSRPRAVFLVIDIYRLKTTIALLFFYSEGVIWEYWFLTWSSTKAPTLIPNSIWLYIKWLLESAPANWCLENCDAILEVNLNIICVERSYLQFASATSISRETCTKACTECYFWVICHSQPVQVDKLVSYPLVFIYLRLIWIKEWMCIKRPWIYALQWRRVSNASSVMSLGDKGQWGLLYCLQYRESCAATCAKGNVWAICRSQPV